MDGGNTDCRHGFERLTPGRRRQRGVSLIELMVSLALSMIVLLGVIDLFIAYQHQYRLQAQLAQMQESGRFVTEVLTRELRKAGYSSWRRAQTFPATLQFAQGAIVAGDDSTLRVRYYGSTDGALQDCLGGHLEGADITRATLSLNGSQGLECAVNGASPQPLDANIEAMALRYFVGDGWRRAARIGDWASVKGVSIELLVASRQDGLVDAVSSYVFNGETVTAADHRLYRVYATSVALRNVTSPPLALSRDETSS
ncbi:type IV pilus assembly protein PilW [Chromohalobacter marismortui]|uniref:Type IV pilus assembly protein PilW n=1 Tax=Chromohalobacter marismortui TaxID=42055 RepID=A0A4V3F2Y8_9GAMM|nr:MULTISPECIES: PilW family protein [Chromohalobacter]MCI0511119.1 prepilin-type N-terminal cleavage/methylation domain-containing protein [Chromohalobacter sp.]MCI0593223.1 prepilin-type N-terminal cleavage/methylation domain-containing protein [Chromohalobacter sp.]TDU19146.1 type IV pilus assembly protein PilW [Chromohalobacter marismortui]